VTINHYAQQPHAKQYQLEAVVVASALDDM